MVSLNRCLWAGFAMLLGAMSAAAAEPDLARWNVLAIEQLPTDSKLNKVVLIGGSTSFKPGEHEYVAGCGVLADLLKQTPGVAPVVAVDWPRKPETLEGAKAVVFFFDGGDKHGWLKEDHLKQVQKLAESGVGFVNFHQIIDVPKDLGDRTREWTGGTWEKGLSQRAHWITEFKNFPEHEISRGVTPFKIDDGWLFKLRFAPELKGITPLLKTVSPKATGAAAELNNDAVVAWAFERANKSRSFTFTGCHLHSSLSQEGYRRFLVNGILWSAQVEIPKSGSPVELTDEGLAKYLKK
jgi:hypothetical protein